LSWLWSQNFLALYDVRTQHLARRFAGALSSQSRVDVCVSPDGRYIACGSEDGEL
jgi:hypothetical protein